MDFNSVPFGAAESLRVVIEVPTGSSNKHAKEQEDIAEFFRQIGVQRQKTMDIEGFFDRAAAIEEINVCRINPETNNSL